MKHLFSQHLYWVLSALLLSVVICEDDSPRLPTTNAKSPLRRFEPRKPQKEETKKSVYSQPPDDPPSTTSVSLDWKDVGQNSNRTLDHLSRNTVPVYAPTEPTGKLVRKNGSPGPGPLLAFKSVTTRTFPEGESIPPTGWALASLKNTIRPYNPTKRPLTTPPIKPISDYWSNRLAKTTTPSTFLDIQQDATVSSKNETEPAKNITEPTKNELEPAKNETEPTKNETEPVKNETEPAKNETEPAKLATEPPKVEDSTEKTENLKINSTDLDIIIKNVSAVENLVKEVKIQNNINETVENVKNETKIDQSTTSMTRATNVTNIPTEKTSTEAIVEKSETLTTIGNDIPDVAVKYKNYTSAPILERNISATTILPFPTMNATSEILTTLSQLEENTTFVENSNSSLSPEITTQFSISKNDENTTKNFTAPSITERIDLEETTFHSKNYTLPNSIIEETTISTKAKKVEKPENETLTTKIYENKTEKTIFENNDIKLRITTPLPTEEAKETTKTTKIETTEPSKSTTVQVTTETPKMTTETPKMTTETPKMTERAKTEQKITSESAKTTEHAKTTTELYLSVPTKNLSGFHYDVENKTESTPIIFRETVDIDEEDSLLYNTTSNDKNDEDDDEDEMDKEEHSSTKTTNSTETPKMTPPIKKIPEETTTEIDESMFDTGVVIPMDVEIIVQAMYSEMCDEKDELKYSIVKLFKTYAGKSVSPKQVLILDLGPQECYENNELMYVSPAQIHLRMTNQNGEYSKTLTELLVGLIRQGHFQFKFPVNRVDTLVSHQVEMEGQLGGTVIAAIVISSIAAVSLLFLTILLVIMRKRQKGFNYGQRCTPVSLDDYSLDNISVYNSVRRKALRASKRSYGNPAFDDPVAVSLPLNFAGLSNAVSDKSKLEDEFSKVPTVTVKMDELPLGAEIKNRYANVIPLPETQVRINSSTTNDVIEQFINANYVKGAKGADKFYIACQAPLPNTIADFWQMIWEQQSKIIIMLTNLHENGVEKCADYLPPSEVLDCHRVFGDLQITLKKREAREKYIISNLQIKNLETNLWREVTHMWYTSWPARGVPDDTSSIIAFLIEARSYAKSGPPVVVHCSPGTGRTGTVIAIDIAIRDFETDRIVDIPKTVYAIRKERAGAVQTREQYRLIYDVLHLYATKLTGGGLDSI